MSRRLKLYTLSLLLFLLSIVLLLAPSWPPPLSLPAPIPGYIETVGSSLLTALIVSLLIDAVSANALLNTVQSIYKSILAGSGVQAGAEEMGITAVYSRSGPRGLGYLEDLESAIKSQLRRAEEGTIRILCTAAPNVIHANARVFKELKKKLPDSNCKLQVLLLCPISEKGLERSGLESGHTTKADIEASARQLEILAKENPGRIEYKCYDSRPAVFAIFTETRAFVEGYPTYPTQEGPLGGHLPMIVAASHSPVYTEWSAHFEYLWTNGSRDFSQHLKECKSARDKQQYDAFAAEHIMGPVRRIDEYWSEGFRKKDVSEWGVCEGAAIEVNDGAGGLKWFLFRFADGLTVGMYSPFDVPAVRMLVTLTDGRVVKLTEESKRRDGA